MATKTIKYVFNDTSSLPKDDDDEPSLKINLPVYIHMYLHQMKHDPNDHAEVKRIEALIMEAVNS